MDNNARFRLDNARIVRVNERPKVCFVTVLCHAGKFAERFDVTLFKAPEFPLEEGAAVNVVGDLSMRKPKEPGGKWELQMIGRTITKGDTEKAPWPKGQSAPTPRQEAPIDDDLLF